MTKLIFGMTTSLDGYINDKNGSVARLYPDLQALGETDLLKDEIKRIGAVVMGRHTYDMANGDYTGYEFQTPIFVVTHHPPEKPAAGENENLKFTFVTDGVASAIAQAKIAAGSKDVTVVGGANLGQDLLNNGLVDELQIGIVPELLGGGIRLFEKLNTENIKLEQIKILETPQRTDIFFRVLKK